MCRVLVLHVHVQRKFYTYNNDTVLFYVYVYTYISCFTVFKDIYIVRKYFRTLYVYNVVLVFEDTLVNNYTYSTCTCTCTCTCTAVRVHVHVGLQN
jgi:hypothetical protein